MLLSVAARIISHFCQVVFRFLWHLLFARKKVCFNAFNAKQNMGMFVGVPALAGSRLHNSGSF